MILISMKMSIGNLKKFQNICVLFFERLEFFDGKLSNRRPWPNVTVLLFNICLLTYNLVIFSDTIFFHKKVSWLWDKKFYVHTKMTILSVCSIQIIVLIFFRKGSLRLRTEKASPKWWKNRTWGGRSNYRGYSLCKFNSPRTS